MTSWNMPVISYTHTFLAAAILLHDKHANFFCFRSYKKMRCILPGWATHYMYFVQLVVHQVTEVMVPQDMLLKYEAMKMQSYSKTDLSQEYLELCKC